MDKRINNFNFYVFKKKFNIINDYILKALIYENFTALGPRMKTYNLHH
jgi:hypothetical protein